jgi:hypothetical protein
VEIRKAMGFKVANLGFGDHMRGRYRKRRCFVLMIRRFSVMGRKKLANKCRGNKRGQRNIRMARSGNWCKGIEIMVR